MTDTYHLTLYGGARGAFPISRDDMTWSELVESLRDIVGRTEASKVDLLAIGPHRLAPGAARSNDAVEAVTLIVLDVDGGNMGVVCGCIDTAGVDAIVYTSPSDDPDGPEDERRFRVIVRPDRELDPAECRPARLALAEALGLAPGCGVEGALDPARIFFAGALEGTAPRTFLVLGPGA